MKQEEPKPIHKFNNGRGATLCNKCYAIISEGLTEELFCEKCKPKQETLEEAAEKYVDINYPNYIQPLEKAAAREDFIAGAKWQAKRMYSKEEVYSLLCSMPNFYNMTIPQQVEARDKWFEQFKK